MRRAEGQATGSRRSPKGTAGLTRAGKAKGSSVDQGKGAGSTELGQARAGLGWGSRSLDPGPPRNKRCKLSSWSGPAVCEPAP